MGLLAEKTNHYDEVKRIITPVLHHFDQVGVGAEVKRSISAAVDIAFSDELLLEKFQLWNDEKDDDVFLYHIKRFFEKQHQHPLSAMEQDLTSRRAEVETEIKEDIRAQQKKIFGERVTILAAERNLVTNEKLGEFLEVSGEQARKFRVGENKPQLATLKKIADRFRVSVGYLLGLSEQR